MLIAYCVRRHPSWTILIFVLSLPGCGPKTLKDMQSADGQISVRIIDPVGCDETRYSEAHFVGMGRDAWLNDQASLDQAACGYPFDPNDYLLLEGPDWLGIASRSTIASTELNTEECVYVFVDRKHKEFYRVRPWKDSTPALWPEIEAEIVRRRKPAPAIQ